MLLHVVKAPLPVQFDVHLLTLLQSRADEMHSLWTLSQHTQDTDTSNRPMIIRLEMKNKKKSGSCKETYIQGLFTYCIYLPAWHDIREGKLTCPPPSGNRIVSFSFRLKPFSFSFFPLFSRVNSAGTQDTTHVSNCKKYLVNVNIRFYHVIIIV